MEGENRKWPGGGTLKSGENTIDGVCVTVIRKKVKNISLRVKADGAVFLVVPMWRATLAQAEAFLRSKWQWVLRARERAMSRPQQRERDFTALELARLQTLVGELHAQWAVRLGEYGVEWRLRRMKTRWGVCNWRRRRVTYAAMLADKPRECVEYVVVHELTHFAVHNHGPRFKALMDERLPNWRALRHILNGVGGGAA